MKINFGNVGNYQGDSADIDATLSSVPEAKPGLIGGIVLIGLGAYLLIKEGFTAGANAYNRAEYNAHIQVGNIKRNDDWSDILKYMRK